MATEEKRAGHRDAESPAGKADRRHEQQGERRPLWDPVSEKEGSQEEEPGPKPSPAEGALCTDSSVVSSKPGKSQMILTVFQLA